MFRRDSRKGRYGRLPERVRRVPGTAWVLLAPLICGGCGGAPAIPPQEQTAITQMERALDAARRGQEAFYGRHGLYTTDPALLEIADVPGQAELVLEYATSDSYFVSASHPDTGWTCFLAQPATRPSYTRCVPPGSPDGPAADSTRLDLVRPAG